MYRGTSIGTLTRLVDSQGVKGAVLLTPQDCRRGLEHARIREASRGLLLTREDTPAHVDWSRSTERRGVVQESPATGKYAAGAVPRISPKLPASDTGGT
mmetsp:Transcript_35322/g.92929  ORF Transcript_35322/g.92929 Transcript_35322/m.92929 type:complete len:99 (+) Transcript_35322:235-531(+)